MQQREVRGGQVTRWAHLGVLLVLAAGFLTMHGFLAVSAQADTHHGQQHQATSAFVTDSSTNAPHEKFAAGPDAAAPTLGPPGGGAADVRAESSDPGNAPDRPTPAEHHDLAAGCVVALVGVALAVLALPLSRSATVEHLRICVRDVVQGVSVLASRWSPPRVALCVIRV